MRFVIAVLVGILIGFCLGWCLSPGQFRLYYTATKSIPLLGSDGVAVARLEPGTRMISSEKLRDAPDLGWWALVAIQFDSMRVARELGVVEGATSREFEGEIHFRADSEGVTGDSLLSREKGTRSVEPPGR